MSGYGSIEKSPTNAPAKRMSLLSAAGIATAVVAATALVAVVTMPVLPAAPASGLLACWCLPSTLARS